VTGGARTARTSHGKMLSEAVPPVGAGAGRSVIPALTTLCAQHTEADASVKGVLTSDFKAALGAHAAVEVARVDQLLREEPGCVQLWPSPALIGAFASGAADHVHSSFSVSADSAPEGVVHWTGGGAAVVRRGVGGGAHTKKFARVIVKRFRAKKNPRLLPGVGSDPQVEVTSIDAQEGARLTQQMSAAQPHADGHAFLLQFKVGGRGRLAGDWTLRFPSKPARDGTLAAARAAASRAGTVRVTVLRARGLKAMGSNGLADPFVVVRCNRTMHQTAPVRKNLAPEWGADGDGSFQYDEVRGGAVLRVDVFDWNRVGEDKPMGRVEVPVVDMDGSEQWFTLEPIAGCPQPQGEIQLCCTFAPAAAGAGAAPRTHVCAGVELLHSARQRDQAVLERLLRGVAMAPQETATLVVTAEGTLVWQGPGGALLLAGSTPTTLEEEEEEESWSYRDRQHEESGSAQKGWVVYPQNICRKLDQAILDGRFEEGVDVGEGTVVDLVRMRHHRHHHQPSDDGGGGADSGGGCQAPPGPPSAVRFQPGRVRRCAWQAECVMDLKPIDIVCTAADRWHCVDQARARRHKSARAHPCWIEERCTECMHCTQAVTTLVRPHHCRRCGWVVCRECSAHQVPRNTLDRWLHETRPHAEATVEEREAAAAAQQLNVRVCAPCFHQHSRTMGTYKDSSNSVAVLGCDDDSQVETFSFAQHTKWLGVRSLDAPVVLVEVFDAGRGGTSKCRVGCTLTSVQDPEVVSATRAASVSGAATASGGGTRRHRWETVWDACGQAVGQVELAFAYTCPRNLHGLASAGVGPGGAAVQQQQHDTAAAQKCQWMWEDAGDYLGKVGGKVGAKFGKFMAKNNPLGRWTTGTPLEVADKLQQETADNPQKHAGRKVRVQWLAPVKQPEQVLESPAAALLFLRRCDWAAPAFHQLARGSYAAPDPSAPSLAEALAACCADCTSTTTLAVKLQKLDELHQLKAAAEARGEPEAFQLEVDVALERFQSEVDAAGGRLSGQLDADNQLDHMASSEVPGGQQLVQTAFHVATGRIYDFDKELEAYGDLLEQFQDRVDTLASDELLSHRARQNALWVLADNWREQLESTMLGRWGNCTAQRPSEGSCESNGRDLSPLEFVRVSGFLRESFEALAETGHMEDASAAEQALYSLHQRLYDGAVAVVELGQSYGAMVHACMLNSLREEVPRTIALQGEGDEGTTFVQDLGTVLEHLLKEITGTRDTDDRLDDIQAAGLVGRQMHATHMYEHVAGMLEMQAELLLRENDEELPSHETIAAEVAELQKTRRLVRHANEQSRLGDHLRDALEDYRPGDLVIKPLGRVAGGIFGKLGKAAAGVVGSPEPEVDGVAQAAADEAAADAVEGGAKNLRYLCRVIRNLDQLLVSFDQLTMELLTTPLFRASEDGASYGVLGGGGGSDGAAARAMREKCLTAQHMVERAIRRALQQARGELGELILGGQPRSRKCLATIGTEAWSQQQ
jgi:hypothetical protein